LYYNCISYDFNRHSVINSRYGSIFRKGSKNRKNRGSGGAGLRLSMAWQHSFLQLFSQIVLSMVKKGKNFCYNYRCCVCTRRKYP